MNHSIALPSRRAFALVAFASAMLLALGLPLAAPVHAASLTIEGVNPDNDGPANIVSDVNGATDSTYHIVARIADPDIGTPGHITTVQARIDDGDIDTTVDVTLAMTRVGTTDTWEAFWDVSAATGANENGGGTISFRAVDAAANEDTDDVGVTFDNTAETVEITSPLNGGQLGFFDSDGDANAEARVSGTVSEGLDTAESVQLFFSTTGPGVDPVWTDCDTNNDVVITDNATGSDTFSGTCELSGATPAQVTMIGARADDLVATEAGDESGDGHRVTGYQQAVTTVNVTPATQSQTTVRCVTFTASARDQNALPIAGLNFDAHAEGPDDFIQLASNPDEAGVTDGVADAFRSPVANVGAGSEDEDHTYTNAEDGADAGGCDTAGEADGAPDDNDSEDTTGAPAADTVGSEGEHDDAAAGADGNTLDTKHIEGLTQADGNWDFSLASETAGTTNLLVWFDDEGNDDQAGDQQFTASVTWTLSAATTLDLEPETSTNVAGENQTFTVTVLDQSGNPSSGVVGRLRVVTGPDADEDLDNNAATPLGYFAECTTASNGKCTGVLDGESGPEGGANDNETGADTVQSWFGSAPTAPPAPEAAAGNPAGTADEQRQDVVTTTYTTTTAATCIDVEPETATKATTATHEIKAYVSNGVLEGGLDDNLAADGITVRENDCTGTLLTGIPVDFAIADDTPDASLVPDTNANSNTERVNTAADGIARVTIDNVVADPASAAAEGVNTVTGDVPGTAEANAPDTVSVTWERAGIAEKIDCEPENEVATTGSNKSVTCTVRDFFDTGVAGANVDLAVVAGPHLDNDLDGNAATPPGYIGEGSTDAAGAITKSYTGNDVTPNNGNDVIDGWIDAQPTIADDDIDNGDGVEADSGDPDTTVEAEEQTDSGDVSDYVDKTWRAAATLAGANVEIDLNSTGAGADDTAPGTTNTKACDADLTSASFGGATWNATDNSPLNSVHLACVSVEETGGNVLVGANVTLTSTGVGVVTDSNGPPPTGASQTAVVGDAGYALLYIHSTQSGVQNLVASATGVTDTDSASETWDPPIPAEARVVDCTPETATRAPGTSQEVVCRAGDGLGNGVPGVAMSWSKVDTLGATSSFSFQQTTTDVNGDARATLSSSTTGTTTVTGSITPTPPATNECTAPAGGPGANDVGKPAGRCSDTSTITWQAPPPKCPGYEADARNQIVGTEAADTLPGTAADDIICGKGGNDIISGGGGNDLILGGGGDDRMSGSAGNDSLVGESGNDQATGGVGNDVLSGGDGNDNLFGNEGNDTLWAGNGSDVMAGGSGNDAMHGGSGIDRVSYYGSAAVNVDLAAGTGTGYGAGAIAIVGSDTIDGTENLTGSTSNDKLVGNGAANRITGEGGTDSVIGGGGNDFLSGGSGNDVLRGDAGADILNGDSGDDKIYAKGDGSKDTVNGGFGTDRGALDAIDVRTSIEILI